jgi:hypothetical protein
MIARSLAISFLTPSLAFAGSFPNTSDICQGGIVVKEKLAKAILKQNPDAMKLYVDANDGAGRPAEYQPQWRRIFTDPNFCESDPGCLAPPLDKKATGDKKPPLDNSAARDVITRLRIDFADALVTNVTGTYYRMENPKIGTAYLLGKDGANSIRCVGPDFPVAAKPFKLTSPVRLRANSDDLGIDAADPNPDQKNAFKNAKPATISYTQDGVLKTNTTKMQAAIGYPIALPFNSETFSYFKGEVVPYLSATQTFTKTAGKAATLADTNMVAVGALLNVQDILKDVAGLENVFYFKPQYLWNTKDKSEIASARFVYAPWTDGALKLNTDTLLGTLPFGSWLTILFDVRNDVGEYTKKGIDPVAALRHTSYDRAGSKFGFVLSTDDHGPHVVLNVSETLLYGFAGSIRRLDYLDSSLTFYFDSTSNFGFTLSYTKGTNPDTSVSAQTVSASLSAKF